MRLLRSFAPLSLVPGLVLIAACSSDPPADGASGGSGGTGNTGSAGMPAGGKANVGGSAGTDGTAAGTGGTASGGAGAGGTGTGGAGAGGSSAGSPPGAGTSGAAGTGLSAGAGGSAGDTTGLAGGAGMAAGGIGGAAGGAGEGGSAGSGGPPACPTGAIFCSGFEDAMLPAGATYLSSNDNNDWTKGTALDKTVFHAGAQSIEILKISSYAQRTVVVPAAQKFWFRAYFRTDVAVGGAQGRDHNLFFEAAFPGGDKGVEIVEEDCMLGMNIADTRFGSNGTKNQPGCPTSGNMGTQLEANTWHCIEGYFDGVAGDAKVFVAGTEVMSLTNESGAKNNYTTLRFGYRHYHERQRLVWYDDLATAAERIGCQ